MLSLNKLGLKHEVSTGTQTYCDRYVCRDLQSTTQSSLESRVDQIGGVSISFKTY